jgi:hypothetical protein
LQNLRFELSQPNDYFRSQDYFDLSAAEKHDQLWNHIMADTESAEFPGSLEIAGIFLESMQPTFTTKGDAMKSGWFSQRYKYIHTVGAVGKVRFVPQPGHSYSGIFQGANHGLVRLSLGTRPGDSVAMSPGMGLKFLRDGIDSANLVSMWSVDGQPGDWNFFSNDFFTHIGKPDTSVTASKLLTDKFSTATDFIQSVGLSDFAMYDEAGRKSSPNMPFSLRFEPHSDVHTLFPKDLGDNDYMHWVD